MKKLSLFLVLILLLSLFAGCGETERDRTTNAFMDVSEQFASLAPIAAELASSPAAAAFSELGDRLVLLGNELSAAEISDEKLAEIKASIEDIKTKLSELFPPEK